MSDFSRLLSKTVATVFFIGYIPFAPGTFGSLAALIFVLLLKPPVSLQVALLWAVFFIGLFSAHFAEKAFGERDSGHIVIDEFAGYLVSVLFLPLTAGYLIAAFFLFRFFDILKPSPIRNVERALNGGLGIMLDDVLAGVATNVILQVIAHI